MAIYEADYLYSDNESVTSIEVCENTFTGTYTGNSDSVPKTFSGKVGAMENITISGKADHLYFTSSSITGIKESTFSGNTVITGGTANATGGVMLVSNSSQVFIEDSVFSDNFLGNTGSGSALGGVIYFSAISGVISGTTFSGNTAEYSGGAIYNSGATVSISGSTFYNNRSGYRGGAV